MFRPPPGSTLTDTHFPYLALCRAYFRLRQAGEVYDDLVGDLLARTVAAARSIADRVPADVGGFLSVRAGHAVRGAQQLARGQAVTLPNPLLRGFDLDRKSTRLNSSH